MRPLLLLLIIFIPLLAFDAKKFAEIFSKENNAEGIRWAVINFTPFTTPQMALKSENSSNAKSYLKRFCVNISEIDSTIKTLTTEEIDRLNDDDIIAIYGEMMPVFLNNLTLSDTLYIEDLRTALMYENMDVYNTLMKKAPSKEVLVDYVVKISVDAFNNTTSSQKSDHILDILSTVGASHLDELFLTTTAMLERAPAQVVYDSLIVGLQRKESKAAKATLKMARKSKDEDKRRKVYQLLSQYVQMSFLEHDEKSNFRWIVGAEDQLMGNLSTFLQFLGGNLLGRDLSEVTIQLESDVDEACVVKNYDSMMIYFLLHCTDENYRPLLLLKQIYDNTPYTVSHRR